MDDPRIEPAGLFKISNIDYDMMSVGEKNQLIKEYRMIGLQDESFYGFWLLVKREGSQS